jgi:cell wall-associated NlpC family hydrolase
MASHRKPRVSTLSPSNPRTLLGITSAALATMTLLSEDASAAKTAQQSSIQEVQSQVDSLNQQAEEATQKYDQAMEQTTTERQRADVLLNQVALGADHLNQSRRILGQFAAEQYRTGGLNQTVAIFLAPDPQQYFEQQHILDRMTVLQRQAFTTFEQQQAVVVKQRRQAAESLRQLNDTQQRLAADKTTVQQKLTQTQDLLNSLTAEQKARLAALRKQQEEVAARKAAQLAAQAQANAATHTTTTTSSSYAAKAAKAIAFAKEQLGKPYVWGATGPYGYDCSGLVQAAWGAAGVSLPRTTFEQIDVGTRVSISNVQPGDLIFYNSSIDHVAMYIGDGQIIQAPHTGANIDIAPMTEMPIYGATRPA